LLSLPHRTGVAARCDMRGPVAPWEDAPLDAATMAVPNWAPARPADRAATVGDRVGLSFNGKRLSHSTAPRAARSRRDRLGQPAPCWRTSPINERDHGDTISLERFQPAAPWWGNPGGHSPPPRGHGVAERPLNSDNRLTLRSVGSWKCRASLWGEMNSPRGKRPVTRLVRILAVPYGG
jgi:hypothetical protein